MISHCYAVPLLAVSLCAFAGCVQKQPAVVPDMRFKRVALAPEQNAFKEWEKAEALFVPLPEEVKQIAAGAWSQDGTPLTPQQSELVEPCVNTNAAALAAFEDSLRKQNAQIPAWDPVEAGPFLRAPSELVKLRLFLADAAAAGDDHSTATNLLLGNLEFAQLLRDADVPLIHYLVMRAGRIATEKGLQRWALFSSAPAERIRSVLAQTPELSEEPEAYEHVLRVEFTDFLIAEPDVAKLAKSWSETVRTNKMLLHLQPEELHRPLELIFDPRLVALHPKPFDTNAQSVFFAPRFAAFAAAARAPWARSDYDALLEQTDELRGEFLSDLKPLLAATEGKRFPLDEEEAKDVAGRYEKLKNPMGRYYQANDNLTRTYVYTFQARTERNATRAVLAIRLYQLQQGKLPASLQDLVKAGLLPSVPQDLFANAPLRYSAERGIIWSVGENEVDDGGVDGKPFWIEKDMVWRIR